MPTYDYRCDECEHTFEYYQPITSKPLRRCPKCGRNRVTRLIGTGGGVIFKGSGFYQTDYRSADYHKSVKAESSSGNSSNADNAKTGSTEPATTTPAKAKAKTGKKEA